MDNVQIYILYNSVLYYICRSRLELIAVAANLAHEAPIAATA